VAGATSLFLVIRFFVDFHPFQPCQNGKILGQKPSVFTLKAEQTLFLIHLITFLFCDPFNS